MIGVYVFIIPTNLDDHTPPISHGEQIIELYDWKHHPPGMFAFGQICDATFFWFVLTLPPAPYRLNKMRFHLLVAE